MNSGAFEFDIKVYYIKNYTIQMNKFGFKEKALIFKFLCKFYCGDISFTMLCLIVGVILDKNIFDFRFTTARILK